MNTLHSILFLNRERSLIAFVFTCVLQFGACSGFAQEQSPEAYFPAMPSPTVASLAKYTDFPEIDQFGLAPITIPLYKLRVSDYTLPITLSYHAAGIRVSQESSWVGLGFDLSAVGFISRSVRDLPDDLEVPRNLTTSSEGLVYQGWLMDPDYFVTFPNLSWAEGSNDEQRAAHILNAVGGDPRSVTKVDGQPDIFYLNVGNIREKFVFDHQAQAVFLEPDSKLQISYSLDDHTKGIREFVVVDSYGNKYYFGSVTEDNTATEKTTISSEYMGNLTPYSTWLPGSIGYYWQDGGVETREFRTAWFIRRIFVQSSHQNIDFVYESTTEEFDVPLDQYYTRQDGSSDPQNPKPILHMLWSGLRSIAHEVRTKYLARIETPDVAVDFDLSGRNDLQGAKKLEKMSVTSLNSNRVVEECTFEYQVVQSEGDGSDYERNRLYLGKVTKKGMPAFEFQYSSVPLPDKKSSKQDLWGFLCAKSTSLIPRIYVYPNQTDHLKYSCFPIVGNMDFHLLDGSDRTTDESSIRAGSLERIKLPTGGFIQIVLEPNDFYDSDWGEIKGGGLRVKEIRKLDAEGEILHKKDYTYKAGSQSSGKLLNGLGFAVPTTYSIPSSNAIMYYQKVNDPNVWDYFTLRKSNNYFPLVNHDGALVSYEEISIVETGNGKIEKVYYPSPTFKSHATPVKWASPYTRPPSKISRDLSSSYVNTGTSVFIDLKGYGLSDDTNWVSVDVYELIDGSMWTTYGPPPFVDFYFVHLGSYIKLHGTDYNPLSRPSVYIVNDESEVDIGEVQKYGSNIFPFPPISDDGIASAGKLHEVRYYLETESVNPVKKVSYTYAAVGAPVSISGLVYASSYVCNIFLTPLPLERSWASFNNYNTQRFIERNLPLYSMPKSWAKYQIIGNQAHRVETETIMEDNVTKSFSFTYNENLVTKEITEVTSKDEPKVTTYKYADDYPYVNGSSAINQMSDLNIVSKPIEKQVTLGQESSLRIISAELQIYKLTTDNLIALDKIARYKPVNIDATPMASTIGATGDFVADERYIDDLEFHKYDSRGNLTQYADRNGIVTSVLWGHNNSLPVAKVENSVLDQHEEIVPMQLQMPTINVAGQQLDYYTVQESIDIGFVQDVEINCAVNRTGDPSIPDSYFNVELALFHGQELVYSGIFGLTTESSTTVNNLPSGRYTLKFRFGGDLGALQTFNFVTSLNFHSKKIYSNIFYTGFEDDPNGAQGEAHTGNYYNDGPFTVLLPKKVGEYILSYWMKLEGEKWKYVENEIVVTSTESQSLVVGDSGVLLDDVRLYPKEATMTTYSYDPLVGITSITDVNSVTTYYQYDDFGRLEYTRDDKRNILHVYGYHYGKE